VPEEFGGVAADLRQDAPLQRLVAVRQVDLDLGDDRSRPLGEDEDAVRNFVVAALEDCGYEVTSVGDGEEALETLEDDKAGFDLIITDVMMPVVDGPTLVKRARVEQALSSRVIFMSAYAENSVREQLDALDGDGYIQKPFTLKGLAAKVKETLSAPEMEDA